LITAERHQKAVINVTLSQNITGLLLAVRMKYTFTNALTYLLRILHV